LSCRQIIFNAIVIEVENLCANIHGNRSFRITVHEEEIVFVRGKNGIRTVEGS
jgi:hypothetical protein